MVAGARLWHEPPGLSVGARDPRGLTAPSATAWLCRRGDAVRKHLNKVVVVVVAILFTTWFLLWPDEEEPLAPPPAADSAGP